MENEPRWHGPNEIWAAYIQMRNQGQNAIFYIGGKAPQSLMEWRDEQLAKWEAAHPSKSQ